MKLLLILLFLSIIGCSGSKPDLKLYLSFQEGFSQEYQDRIRLTLNQINIEAGKEIVSLNSTEGRPLVFYRLMTNELFAHAEYRDYRCLIQIVETQSTTQSDFDLKYVVLHELGHCYGYVHSNDMASVMYPYYSGTATANDSEKNYIQQKMNSFYLQINNLF